MSEKRQKIFLKNVRRPMNVRTGALVPLDPEIKR